jgi:hypothetical protein
MATASPQPQAGSSWTAGRILLVILGSIVALLAAGLLAAGGALLWADRTQRDDDGYLTTPTERFESGSFAITSESIDLFEADSGGDWVLSEGVLGDVRITGESSAGSDVFIGIAETADVDAYLDGVERDEVRDLDFDPFRVEYRRHAGGEPPGPPGEQTFWAASASGPGTQRATWEAESGEWTVVVMNADGSRGVATDLSAGAEANFLIWLAIGLLVAGALLLAGGVLLIYLGARGATAAAPAAVPAAAAGVAGAAATAPALAHTRPTVYPVAVRGELGEDLSRWLWVVKWLLAIPHYILLALLWIAVWILTVIAFFAILFTGRYPRGIFDFNVGVLRWSWRVAFYSYWALGTDRYPPFTLAEEPDYPATVEVAYPERLSHWLPLVKWLLAIPHLLLVAIFVGGWGWGWSPFRDEVWGLGFAGLVGILVLIAGLALLFTGRYPGSLFDFTLGLDRWAFRVAAYVFLLRDEYPPFRLDMGPTEPAAPSEATEPAEQPPPAH